MGSMGWFPLTSALLFSCDTNSCFQWRSTWACLVVTVNHRPLVNVSLWGVRNFVAASAHTPHPRPLSLLLWTLHPTFSTLFSTVTESHGSTEGLWSAFSVWWLPQLLRSSSGTVSEFYQSILLPQSGRETFTWRKLRIPDNKEKPLWAERLCSMCRSRCTCVHAKARGELCHLQALGVLVFICLCFEAWASYWDLANNRQLAQRSACLCLISSNYISTTVRLVDVSLRIEPRPPWLCRKYFINWVIASSLLS